MTRSSSPAHTRSRALTVALALLLILALAPARYTRWVSQFGGLTEAILAPASYATHALLGIFLLPSRTGPAEASLRRLQEERDQFQAMYLQQRRLNAELQRQLEEYRIGTPESDLGLRLLAARVIGSRGPGQDILLLKAGSRHGVENGTVATVAGTQIVGRVEDVSPISSSLVLLTSRSLGPVDGTVLPGDDAARAIPCRRLHPQGDGTLRGYVEYVVPGPGEEPMRAEVGQVVRLSDPTWPASSQMLILGVIERIDAALGSPLRQVITVRPTVRLERVTEVTLRLVARPEEPPP